MLVLNILMELAQVITVHDISDNFTNIVCTRIPEALTNEC